MPNINRLVGAWGVMPERKPNEAKRQGSGVRRSNKSLRLKAKLLGISKRELKRRYERRCRVAFELKKRCWERRHDGQYEG